MDQLRKRILYRNSRPNPLFEEWISELLNEAIEKKSRLEPLLREAYNSIKKYPLRLESGADCAILKGFHKHICAFIDYRFSVYESIIAEELEEGRADSHNTSDIDERGYKICERTVSSSNNDNEHVDAGAKQCSSNALTVNMEAMPIASDEISATSAATIAIARQIARAISSISEPQNRVSSSSAKTSYSRNFGPTPEEVVPNTSANDIQNAGSSTCSQNPKQQKRRRMIMNRACYRTGSCAILLGLLNYSRLNPDGALTKDRLIKIAQKYCDESFIQQKPHTYYTAWSNMFKLVRSGLVLQKQADKTKYCLTEAGKKVAIQILRNSIRLSQRPLNDSISLREDSSDSVIIDIDMEPASSIAGETIQFPAGSFDIILLIDKNETSGVSKKDDPTVTQFNKYPELKHEYRSLKVGDFTWIAQHRETKQELVLPYIVERKRMDDLAASIKDGRFHEQKFRLHKCGVSIVIYLIEAYGKNKNVGLPIQNLRQALANTRIQNYYKILASDSLANTVRLLTMMTSKITNDYKDKPLKGHAGAPSNEQLMTYEHFCKVAAKNKALTVKGLYLKQLLQLKGLSVEKALAITNAYGTPRLLVEEYKKLDQSQGEMLLADLKYGDLSRNVGPNVSKAVYELFTHWPEE